MTSITSSGVFASSTGAESMPLRDLGELADPDQHHQALCIEGCDPSILRSQLRSMLAIRMVEQHLAAMRKGGQIGGPVHLGVGQEAVAVGVSQHLRRSD